MVDRTPPPAPAPVIAAFPSSPPVVTVPADPNATSATVPATVTNPVVNNAGVKTVSNTPPLAANTAVTVGTSNVTAAPSQAPAISVSPILPINGFQEWIEWTPANSANFVMEATWPVPPPPQTSNNQLIAWFIGASNLLLNGVDTILQPVLIYNGGTGNPPYPPGFSVLCVLASSYDIYFTTPIPVVTGQVLNAILGCVSPGTYYTEFVGIANGLLVTNLQVGVSGNVRLTVAKEAYDLTTATDLMGQLTQFTGIGVVVNGVAIPAAWAPYVHYVGQDQGVVGLVNVNPNGSVYLN